MVTIRKKNKVLPVQQTFKTNYGRVELAFAWVDGEIKVKCKGVFELRHSFISGIQYDHLLVPVKEGRLGLPFLGDKGPVWLMCSKAVQEALDQVDWAVIKVLLLAQAQKRFKEDGEELDAEIRKLAEEKRKQLHTQGTLHRLLEEKRIEEALTLIHDYFLAEK